MEDEGFWFDVELPTKTLSKLEELAVGDEDYNDVIKRLIYVFECKKEIWGDHVV